ncbi:hypothetical protein DASC09_006530 [Saccharomycopsis crataegensis]|uniref:Karyogamy protein n=1 Tax=Saccharomycopsis crataegensis TaxID=43959 RepID=A0AAV5QGM3_9ASCO|nr:hypothetical protein DASC09_006530 [Saccharomycopsis crataegensis]
MHQYQAYQASDQDSVNHMADKVSVFTGGSSHRNEYYDINSHHIFDQVSGIGTIDSQRYGSGGGQIYSGGGAGDEVYIQDFHLDSLLLSDILKTCPSFSFFDELINIKSIEQAHTLLHYDLIKINNSILDISSYLNELILLLENLDTIANNNSPLNKYYDNIEWIFEGKTEISQISKNVDGIDSIISQLLHIIESKIDETTNDDEFFDEINNSVSSSFDEYGVEQAPGGHNCEKKKQEYLHLLGNFDEISDLSLRVKQYLIGYKKRLDIAIQYHELYYQILDSVNDEIENCLKDSFRTHEVKFSLQVKEINQYDMFQLGEKINKIVDNLHEIASKRKSAGMRSSSIVDLANPGMMQSFSETNARYPIFDDSERELYAHLSKLKASIDPIKASIDYIKPQIQNYSQQEEIEEFYPSSIENLNIKFDSIEEKFVFLINDLDDLKFELVEKKWMETFEYFTFVTDKHLSETIKDLQTLGILSDENFGNIDKHAIVPIELENDLKELNRDITIIQKAFDHSLIENESLKNSFKELVLSRWNNRIYHKLPKEFLSEWFGVEESRNKRPQSLMNLVGNTNNHSINHNNNNNHHHHHHSSSSSVHDHSQPRVLRLRSKRNTVSGPSVPSSSIIPQNHNRTSSGVSQDKFVKKDFAINRRMSIGTVVSPNSETEFQARSFSLSRSNTMNQLSSSIASPYLLNNQEAVVSPISVTNPISPLFNNIDAINDNKHDQGHNNNNDNNDNDNNNNETRTFGLGFNSLANNLSGHHAESTPETGKRHLQRRSITGSLLIGKMNLQPVLVEGTPTSPEKKQQKQGFHQESKQDSKTSHHHQSMVSPRMMKSNQFNGITPRMGLLGVNRDFKVLSTVESVADEDSRYFDDSIDESFDSPLTQKTQRIGKNGKVVLTSDDTSPIMHRGSYGDVKIQSEISMESNLSAIENGRLEALRRLGNGQHSGANQLDHNILDQLDSLTLDDLQQTLKSTEEIKSPISEASSSASNNHSGNRSTFTFDQRTSTIRNSLHSPRSSISRLPVAKVNNGSSGVSSKAYRRFNISSPNSSSFENDSSANDISINEDQPQQQFGKILSRNGSITSATSSTKKSSLVPIPASQVSRIRSPESLNFDVQHHPEPVGADSSLDEESMKTMERIKKLKKGSDKRSSWIPQPKTSVMSRSSSSKTISSYNEGLMSPSDPSSSGNVAAAPTTRRSLTGKSKKRNSSGRAKIIARKEFV